MLAPMTDTPDTNDRLLAASEAYDRDDAGPAERAEFLAAREAAAPTTSIADHPVFAALSPEVRATIASVAETGSGEDAVRDRAHVVLARQGVDAHEASPALWSAACETARSEIALELAQARRVNHTPPDMSSRIFAWLDALEANYRQRGYDNGIRFEQQPPRGKYSRIVQCDADGSARSVHAFLDVRTGDIFKPAGWKAPAKHVRFNLLDDASFARLISTCDWSGRYLYLR